MKKALLFICLISLCRGIQAQSTDSIPNSGFENWLWFVGMSNPEGWITNNNNLLANSVVPDQDAHSGIFAMKLVNQGAFIPYASCAFPLVHHPLALTGFLKNSLASNDSATMLIHLYENSILVDSGYQILYGGINPNYTFFNFPVTQSFSQADSCVIEFYGGALYQSSVMVDDLSFTFPSGIHKIESPVSFSIGPNPTNGPLNIYSANFFGASTIAIFDWNGRKVCEKNVVMMNQSELIDLKMLPCGVYLLTIDSDNRRESRLVMKY